MFSSAGRPVSTLARDQAHCGRSVFIAAAGHAAHTTAAIATGAAPMAAPTVTLPTAGVATVDLPGLKRLDRADGMPSMVDVGHGYHRSARTSGVTAGWQPPTPASPSPALFPQHAPLIAPAPQPVTPAGRLAPTAAGAGGPYPVPAGWPVKTATPIWAWLARTHAPLPVVVAGAEGGVGCSTVAVLLAETIAAGSADSSTLLVDQCGSAWGSLARRALGQRAGMAADQAAALLDQGVPVEQVWRMAPRTSAGAAVLTDTTGYTRLRDVFRMVQRASTAMVVDAGRVDTLLTARAAELRAAVVLVGRADIVGAEAVCAALAFLAQHGAHRPVIVLTSPAPGERGRARAAHRLIAAAGGGMPVHLPFDSMLAGTQISAPDRFAKPSAAACLRLLGGIVTTTQQEVLGYGR